MTPLFTIKFGSHLYGTNVETSDVDYKTIYLPDLTDLLVGKKPEIYSRRTAKSHESTQPGEVETELIPIQFFAKHFLGSQSYALEIAHAFNENVNVEFVEPKYQVQIETFINELIKLYSNKDISSIVGYSKSQAIKYGLKGERLDAIKDLTHLVETYTEGNGGDQTIAEVAEIWYDGDTKKPIFITTLPVKPGFPAQLGLSIGNKTFAFNTTLKHFLKALKILEDKYGERSKSSLDGHDWKAIAHAIRITSQGVELLKTGKIKFPSPIKDYLLLVRQGIILDTSAFIKLDELYTELKEAQDTTHLPPMTKKMSLDFDEWLKDKMKKIYLPRIPR